MEAGRAAAQALPKPKSVEEVDAWLANYLAVIDAARAEALRVEQLRDAAPDMLNALLTAERFLSGQSYNAAQLAEAVKEVRAAIAKAGKPQVRIDSNQLAA